MPIVWRDQMTRQCRGRPTLPQVREIVGLEEKPAQRHTPEPERSRAKRQRDEDRGHPAHDADDGAELAGIESFLAPKTCSTGIAIEV